MISLKIKEIAENTLGDRKQGKEFREKIKQLIQKHGKVEIDMQNITDFTPSFLEEGFVMLPIEMGKEEFKKSVILKNIDPAVKGLMNSMLTNKLKLIERHNMEKNKEKEYLFYKAVAEDNLKKVEEMLKDGFNPNIVYLEVNEELIDDKKVKILTKKTPLITAIKNNSFDMVKLLVEHGVDVNTPSYQIDVTHEDTENDRVFFKESPLEVAILDENEKIANYLISKNADLNIEIKNVYMCKNLLDVAIYKEMYDIAKQLIDKNFKNDKKALSLALFPSIDNRNSKAIEALTQEGADVNIRNRYGETPLMEAIKNGDFNIANALVKLGAKLDVKNYKNNTIFHIFSEKLGFYKNSDKGIDFIKNVMNLIEEKEGGKEKLKQLINMKNSFGNNPLHNLYVFCKENEKNAMKFIEMLVEKGIDINAKNLKGETPLSAIIETSNNKNILKKMIELGADVNIKDNVGNTPLHKASEVLDAEAVKILIENGADVNALNNYDENPLHRLFNSHLLDISAMDDEEFSEISEEVNEITQTLINKGVELEEPNIKGFSPIDLIEVDNYPFIEEETKQLIKNKLQKQENEDKIKKNTNSINPINL